jgi:hydrogenase nickel incorporation protein HypA/HybF
MHEYGIVESLLSQVDKNVRAYAGQRAVRIVLAVTGATVAEEGLLREAFEQFKSGTTAGAAELVLERVPLKVYCLDCENWAFPADGHGLRCPRCGSGATLPADRHDVCLKSVEIEV